MRPILLFTIGLLVVLPVQAENYYVVTGSFESKTSAEDQVNKVRQWFSPTTITETKVRGITRFRVLVGPITDPSTAEQTRIKAADRGFSQAWTFAENSKTQTSSSVKKPDTVALSNPSNDSSTSGPSPASDPRISRQSHIEVSRFIYTAPALESGVSELLATVSNRQIQTSELLGVKDRINQLYVTNGYVNTGVIIPDQQIHNSELELQFISGKISELQINSQLRRRYIQSRLDISEPFNLVRLQSSLKLLEQDPMVTRIDARVAPGVNPGEATLALEVETSPKFQIELYAANDRSPSIGSENGKLTFAATNLTGWGETYRVGTSVTEGLDAFDATIGIPLTSGGTSLQLQYALSDSSVIEEPFDDIDVESETESLGLMLNIPVYKTLARDLSLQLTIEARRNQTSLLGQPFSFSEGAVNGESRVAPVRLAIAYTAQNTNDSLAARLSISRGTSKFDATNSGSEANGYFTSYLAQLQYSKLLAERFHITARVLAQHASDPLLSVEKYALGGINTVRGYRQNQVVRDNAYLASIEAHYRLDLPIWIDLIGFLDWGSGENHDNAATGGKSNLASIGLGVAVQAWQGFSLELYLAHGFDDFAATEYNLQDDGVHFRLGYQHEF
tara:strand:+ start:3312 stop:5171 length:1860 start_codon:yes stop_codon:yes gene_type:complete